MEVAVTAVLAEQQLTARDVFGDWRILPGFKPSRRTVSQAAGGPPPESLAAAGGTISLASWRLGRICEFLTFNNEN